jgi:hypothetical protein
MSASVQVVAVPVASHAAAVATPSSPARPAVPAAPKLQRGCCEHAVKFISDGGTANLPIVRDVAFVAMRPRLQSALPPPPPPPAQTRDGAPKQAVAMSAAKCFDCVEFCSRLSVCLHCVRGLPDQRLAVH